MTNQQHDDNELTPSQTTDYKPGEKKSIQEYQTLDTNARSERPLLASVRVLGLPMILTIALEVAGYSDIILDLSIPEALQTIKNKPFIIKVGIEYRMKVLFKIQHDVVSSLNIQINKTKEIIGSYSPVLESYEKKFVVEKTPTGILVCSHYEAKSKFVNDNNIIHIEWN
ncbi:immunoglobulin E-set [Jimgerdemannia flammicorona]|uniref:Immunoglobulin E-set n=1 Tax=Jimgerdemannia flammicorona TaxID=994334 RepID=A0A433QQL9_9FUNG|nr:immunoglobulin E-set [Jimgerdemannia flammicorona]